MKKVEKGILHEMQSERVSSAPENLPWEEIELSELDIEEVREEGGLMAIEAVVTADELSAKNKLQVISEMTFDDDQDVLVAEASVQHYAKSFGVSFDELSQVQQFILRALVKSCEGMPLMRRELRKSLVALAFEKMQRIEKSILESQSVDQVRDQLFDLMKTMDLVAEQMSPVRSEWVERETGLKKLWDAQNDGDREEMDGVFEKLLERFESLKNLKRVGSTSEIEKVFDEVFSHFEELIEYDLAEALITHLKSKNISVGLESAMHQLYGRSKEEVEALKQRNRKDVVAYLRSLSNVTDIDIDQLIEMYRINNRGVTPRTRQRLREGDESVSFGLRIGLHSTYAEKEIRSMLQEAQVLMTKAKTMSTARYTIAAARLHNILLDIHPFSDRNGSTAMLLLERLMMQKGYVPKEKRSKEYYAQLKEVLNENPLAVGVVAYEQFKIHYRPGYYESRELPLEVKELYDRMSAFYGEMIKEQRRESRKARDEFKKNNKKGLKESLA